MSTLQQLTHGLQRIRDSLSEGWQQLYERAGHALTRFSPRTHSGELETREEQLMQQSQRWGLLAADIKEEDDQLVVRMEVPGMESDQFEINVIDNHLVVSGEKRAAKEESRGRYHVVECAYGRFERAIPLPVEVDDSGASARYRRGILSISLPKSTRTRSRRIAVEG